MNDSPNLDQQFDAFIESQYYSEEFELVGAFQSLMQDMAPAQKEDLRKLLVRRVTEDPSLVHVVLCGCFNVDEAVPALISELNTQTQASYLSRSLIKVLSDYACPDSIRAVERWLSSEQKLEALVALSRMDFSLCLSYLAKELNEDYMRDVGLLLLGERKQKVGLDMLVKELNHVLPWNAFQARGALCDALEMNQPEYNPFSPLEIECLKHALNEPHET